MGSEGAYLGTALSVCSLPTTINITSHLTKSDICTHLLEAIVDCMHGWMERDQFLVDLNSTL